MSGNLILTIFTYATTIGLVIYMIRHAPQTGALVSGVLQGFGGYIGGFGSIA